ncbi:hypothetical protein IC235_11215 [Hymenobacter sp. BT664]|uniref:Uncharacterized protein n=1 Tax=Hymenobacter montanus TaxID=2771359 RepID=A0A927GJS9_9BACT|nr:hypothetical protein [Hymenobacter montanus]MBD2768459.1 hypothetical protein [Hymenobacter montanus]
MIARISPAFPKLAAACFPVPGCMVRGYAKAAGYCVTLFPPQPWAGPAGYPGSGATCYEALAAAVQLFHESAHAYPDARLLAAAGSYSPPQPPQDFPGDDEPESTDDKEEEGGEAFYEPTPAWAPEEYDD